MSVPLLPPSRGELHLFLGAAPGVGKTSLMLREAHRLRDEGRDVVIGLIETHGRAETAALIGDLEMLPLRSMTYNDHVFEELNVPAILTRNPEIVLVDELAHRNIPGSTHAHRWQDVEQILDAGISVYATVNVQHVNEYADIASGITGTEIRETIPDSLIAEAETVRLIDVPVAELIKRLEQGKIYPPGQAEKALANYFQIGTLSALRELALRRTAAEIDDDLTTLMLGDSRSILEATTRVVVLASDDPGWSHVIRTAWRFSRGMQGTIDVIALPEIGTSWRSLAEDLGVAIHDIEVVADATFPALVDVLRELHCTDLVVGFRVSTRRFTRSRTLTTPIDTAAIADALPYLDLHLVPLHS